MSRQITTHRINECNDAITIDADDRNPENGNASHVYTLSWHEADESGHDIDIPFQNGPINEVGVNGVTNEALLAILIDRIEGFQTSKWSCEENAVALRHLKDARAALNDRTRARADRGVEGTHEV